jgi:hypothetical protein
MAGCHENHRYSPALDFSIRQADYPAAWNATQLWQAMQLSGVREPKLCLIATATGDAREYIDAVLPIATALGAVATHLTLFPQPNVPRVREHLLAQDVINARAAAW